MSEPTPPAQPTPPPANNSGGGNLVCGPCYLSSQGGKMTEASVVFAGQSLCFDHMNKVYDALEAQPDVTPH